MPEFDKILIAWYQQNKRNLPWRSNNDPYFVWVSEIILQQTRVDTGTDYFLRFIKTFPDAISLANAEENDVLKLWQGLGYYSRARNMHAAALQIINEYTGGFPSSYVDIRKLKGVGDYTAAAIASISFGLPYPVIDGNVFRVLSRIFGVETAIDTLKGKREFTELASLLIDKENPGQFNEALMEFGALQCTPKNPECPTCPFNDRCIALSKNEISNLPVKLKQTKVRKRYFNYLLVNDGNSFYIEKRVEKDIWHNLYQFPLIETSDTVNLEELISNERFVNLFDPKEIVIGSMGPEIVHLLTHQRLHVKFIDIKSLKVVPQINWIKVSLTGINNFPVPKIINDFLSKMHSNNNEE